MTKIKKTTIKRLAKTRPTPKQTSAKKQTIRQKKLIKIFSENFGVLKGKSQKTIYEMMIDAGFSKSTAKQQSTVLAGVKSELQTIADKLIMQRDKALRRLDKTISKAEYKDLVTAIDKFTKNIELLSGRPTDRQEQPLSEDQMQEIKDIFNENK